MFNDLTQAKLPSWWHVLTIGFVTIWQLAKNIKIFEWTQNSLNKFRDLVIPTQLTNRSNHRDMSPDVTYNHRTYVEEKMKYEERTTKYGVRIPCFNP